MRSVDAGDAIDPFVVAIVIVLALILIAVLIWWYRQRSRQLRGAPGVYGLDFSWARPDPQAIKDAGYEFVCRYLSWDDSGKNLTADEARSYLALGINVVSNWEYSADEALSGYGMGVNNAMEASIQHDECGGGPNDPIYFSVDWDVQPGQYSAVLAYFEGIKDVIGIRRVGIYGGYDIVKYALDTGFATFGWQTYAWSEGRWDPRAQLRQIQNGVSFNGCEVDINQAMASNYGAWGQSDSGMGDGGVLIQCPYEANRLDLFYVTTNGLVKHRWTSGGMQSLWNGTAGSESLGGHVVVGTLSATWLPDNSGINVVALGAPDEDDCPPGCGNYWGIVIYRNGNKSGWGSLNGSWGLYPDAQMPWGRAAA